MAFTDKDLKRLKEATETEQIHKGDWINLGMEDLRALISRLEAAERFEDYLKHWSNCQSSRIDYLRRVCDCGLLQVLEVWRKTSGK